MTPTIHDAEFTRKLHTQMEAVLRLSRRLAGSGLELRLGPHNGGADTICGVVSTKDPLDRNWLSWDCTWTWAPAGGRWVCTEAVPNQDTAAVFSNGAPDNQGNERPPSTFGPCVNLEIPKRLRHPDFGNRFFSTLNVEEQDAFLRGYTQLLKESKQLIEWKQAVMPHVPNLPSLAYPLQK